MQPFAYHRATSLDEACRLAAQPGTVLMAGMHSKSNLASAS